MLTRDDRLIPTAIAAAAEHSLPAAPALAACQGAQPAEAAAWAIIAGLTGQTAAVPALIAQLGEDGLPGSAAAWALGQLKAEAAVIAALPAGRIDTRQNGYHALAMMAAAGAASPGLAAFLVERIEAEIERVRTSGSGLAEQAAKALAVLGHPRFGDLVERIIDADRFCDRYELDRLRQAVADDGRDRFAIADLTAAWTVVFADHLAAAEPAPAPADVVAETQVEAPVEAPVAADERPAEAGAPAAGGGPIDWDGFNRSPEFAALPQAAQGLIAQLGPMLEQLAQQAIRAPLADLSGQEFAALLLQVLPQALPPQHLQAALHPHALNGYQALFRFLARTGAATQGDSLVEGVKTVRKQMQAQMRRTGMLGGPDYSDPDEKGAEAPKA